MLAVIKFAGHQYIVSPGDHFCVSSKLSAQGEVQCDKVLLLTEPDGGNFQLGTPYIPGAVVTCKVVGVGREKKIRVYKMQPKKRFRKTYGHKQDYTELEVLQIAVSGKVIEAAKAAKAPVKKVSEKPKKTIAEAKKTEKKKTV